MSYPMYHDPDESLDPYEQRRRQSCLSKATYRSRELAEAGAVAAEVSGGLVAREVAPYQCRYCSLWHLSRRSS